MTLRNTPRTPFRTILRKPLPRLLLIGDRFTEQGVAAKIFEAVKCGVHWVQLRDHKADDDVFLSAAQELVGKLRSVSPGILISINSRVGVAESLACALHVGKRGPAVEDARSLIQAGLPIGVSIHDLEDAAPGVADYFIWSPVYETTSKPGAVGTGLDLLHKACTKAASMPVIAMGGISIDRIGPCLSEGAYGVAVLSGILGAENIHDAVNLYLDALEVDVV